MMTRALEPPIGVVGIGMLGGSLVRALRAAFPAGTIVAVDPNADSRDLALRAGAVTRTLARIDHGDALEDCTVIFVCVPLEAMRDVFTDLARACGSRTGGGGPLITDVAGVKGVVDRWAKELLGGLRFVGGHPMAGGHSGGFAASTADLFADTTVAVCPSDGSPTGADALALAGLWKRLRARPAIMAPEVHDAIVARTSHLPYLAAVAHMLLMAEDPDRRGLVGRGLADATRHAAFAPEVMAAVVAKNPEAPAAARDLARVLVELADLAERDADALAARAAEARALRKALGI